MNRAFFFVSQKNFKDGIADYSRVLELDGRNVSALVNRANAYVEVGSYQDALADYSKAQRLNKTEVAIYRGRGWVYQLLGKTDFARAAIEEGLKIAPDDQWLSHALKNAKPAPAPGRR
jgi:tetratricopeptide (TPR) repeat protein